MIFVRMVQVPVYGAQWHPERPQFEWHKIDPNTGLDPVNHDAMAVLAMQSFANFFVGEVCVCACASMQMYASTPT